MGNKYLTRRDFLKKSGNVALAGAAALSFGSLTGCTTFSKETSEVVGQTIDDDGQLSLIGRKKLVRVALEDALKAAPGGYEAKRGSSEGHFVEVDAIKLWETPVERIYSLVQAGSTLIAGGRETLLRTLQIRIATEDLDRAYRLRLPELE